jgi:hypothetical protein
MRTRLCQSSTSALTLARDWLVEFNAEAGWMGSGDSFEAQNRWRLATC